MLGIFPRVFSPITVFFQVSLIYQCWSIVAVMFQVKNATRDLASPTKMMKSFAKFGNKLDPLDS